MLGRRVWAALAPLAMLLLAGCNSLASGPSRAAPPGFDAAIFKINPSEIVLAQDWTKYDSDAKRKTARNDFVTARMYLIDRAYYDFESTMLQDMRTGGFLGDFITAAMTSGSAIIDDREIERFLSTGATIATTGRQAFDKQVMMDRTVQTLQNQMRANRATVKGRILERLALDYDEWNIGLAQSDIEDYYQAGTLVGALTAAADSATTRKIEAEATTAQMVSSPYRTDAPSVALRTYLYRQPADRTERNRRRDLAQAKLNELLASRQMPSQRLFTFVATGSDEVLKKQLLEKLRAEETNETARSQLAALLSGLN